MRFKDGKNIAIRRRKVRDDVVLHDVWGDIPHTASTLIERLDYPTQKPRLLYERMIKASSREGDLVLDPFCGGGTTLDAAQALKRRWIGIDISLLAFDPIASRLKDRYGLKFKKDYEVIGYPTDMQNVEELNNDKTKHDEFSLWAITRLGLKSAKSNEEESQIKLWKLDDRKRDDVRIVAEVKAGRPNKDQVHIFQKLIEKSKADMGILITLEPVTDEMREIADELEKFEYKGLLFPRLQFWQITDAYFKNPDSIYDDLQIPGKLRVRKTTGTERYLQDIQFDMDLK